MRIAIYTRVSTLDQAREGYSLDAQRKTLITWCKDHGHTITRCYTDEGISGKDIGHRPAMLEMLADIGRGEVDAILVWALSRLTRSVADLYNVWETLSTHNCGLISYTEAFNTATIAGRAMMGILGVFAQMEREYTVERVRVAAAERAAQGKRTCNEVLGYDLDGKTSFKVNPIEAERVRYIFDRYLEYQNLSAVAELCNLRGYAGKRGHKMKAESIRTVLTRALYAGYNSFHGTLYKGAHEPIISVEKFNRVQRMLQKRGKKRIYTTIKKEDIK